jgi:hypothetical protein
VVGGPEVLDLPARLGVLRDEALLGYMDLLGKLERARAEVVALMHRLGFRDIVEIVVVDIRARWWGQI